MRKTEFTEYRRVVALDVLRGLAILGTLLTNIFIFSLVDAEAASKSPANSVAMTLLNLVTDGKFIGLLTIMFGIGLEIQRQSAVRRGQPWPGTYPWRAALLILDGILNYVFIFEFDVLMGYGMTALVVAAVMARSPRAQKIWMYVALVVHVTAMLAMTVLLAPKSGEKSGVAQSVNDVFAGYKHSSYWDDVDYRIANVLAMRTEIPFILLMGVALFLVGAHLYRAGLFQPRAAKLRRRIMLLSFGIGLPLDWGMRLFVDENYSGIMARYVTSACVSIGLLAAVAAFYARHNRLGRLGELLSYVGRMALTCYLAQNLIAAFVFYDYGLGIAKVIEGPHSVLYTLGIYVVISAILILGSIWWLSRHQRGPVEILWHASYLWIVGRRSRRRATDIGAQADQSQERQLAHTASGTGSESPSDG
ncbi:MAG: DUF418 domain-containing protein [Actinomycetaceae bacterium]|nr:DUF418 domain-containing protein [Actinomycetaceae bacterium]